ncbi:hypothetical protein VUR80DRAFT_7674 [Thermomyces stellatus]
MLTDEDGLVTSSLTSFIPCWELIAKSSERSGVSCKSRKPIAPRQHGPCLAAGKLLPIRHPTSVVAASLQAPAVTQDDQKYIDIKPARGIDFLSRCLGWNLQLTPRSCIFSYVRRRAISHFLASRFKAVFPSGSWLTLDPVVVRSLSRICRRKRGATTNASSRT